MKTQDKTVEATNDTSHDKVSRADLIKFLNEDLSREYQAIIAYTVYSQVLKGAEYMNIAAELELHAAQEAGPDFGVGERDAAVRSRQ